MSAEAQGIELSPAAFPGQKQRAVSEVELAGHSYRSQEQLVQQVKAQPTLSTTLTSCHISTQLLILHQTCLWIFISESFYVMLSFPEAISYFFLLPACLSL